MLKYIDKFLKFLKTDRNTFVTYIFSLISIYIVVDRLVEMFFLFFTGISLSYWGPIQYTLAIGCVAAAYFFSPSSSFVKSYEMKWAFLYVYVTAIYIVGISMVVQWMNQILWLLLLSVPNYAQIVTEFGELVKPAFTAAAIYLPITTFYPVIDFMVKSVQDTKDHRDSIWDYAGININPGRELSGAYSLEMPICKDRDTGKTIKIANSRRFESTMIVGASGSGKTSLFIEPMMAKDFEKKFFFKEMSKEMGYTALKTGIANLNCPYTNEYINEHFNLNMLTPVQGKEELYKAYMKKMIHHDGSTITYKDIGITAMASDYESIDKMIGVAKNYGFDPIIIDPMNSNSMGLNPFAYDHPLKVAGCISLLLRGMLSDESSYVAFKSQYADQAVENVAILLKEVYPKINNGTMPTLEDMLKLLSNFDMLQELCEELENDLELAEKYALQVSYFKKYFYKDSNLRKEMEEAISSSVTQLDNLLRSDIVKNVLCNRTNNIDYEEILEQGNIVFLCTRRGDIGPVAHRALGKFFLLLMQSAILRRPGTENSRIGHFLYIDEFADFIGLATEPLFTLYRKYRIGPIITVHNLDQLGSGPMAKYRNIITSNSSSKLVMGAVSPDDEAWWVKEFGKKREWMQSLDFDGSKLEYTGKFGNARWGWKDKIEEGKLESMGFKECFYKVKSDSGTNSAGMARVDFMDEKHKEPQKSKSYDFARFTTGVTEQAEKVKKKNNRATTSNILTAEGGEFDKTPELDPIKTDNSDSKYLFDNENAIVVDFKKRRKNNN